MSPQPNHPKRIETLTLGTLGKPTREPWVYLDGNAISALWDWHTEVTVEGKTGDPRDASPFQYAVLSDYSLDEIVTTKVSNSYKKHLMLLTIYPDIPVLRALEHVDVDAAQLDRSTLLYPPEFVGQVAGKRMMALAGDPQSVADLETDLEKKQGRICSDIAAAAAKKYVPQAMREPIEDVIRLGIAVRGWNPSKSAKDFFELCKYLHSCEVTRYIDRPSSERKGASRILNQQIDYYHLSYIPFVKAFVTNDSVLRGTAQKLTTMFFPEVEIHDVASYHSKWIRDRRTSTG